jgi:hypothetical protein
MQPAPRVCAACGTLDDHTAQFKRRQLAIWLLVAFLSGAAIDRWIMLLGGG